MAFDAGFVAAVVHELTGILIGARVEKVQQPDKDAILLTLHPDRAVCGVRESQRLLIDAGSNNPRIGFTTQPFENPKAAPMFCMLLRKHLTGARISGIRQLGFERAVEIAFEAHDEMGFACTKYLISETMGKCSNLMFLDKDYKIVSALKVVDFSTSQKRQVLPGVTYELPPLQSGKITPLGETREHFLALRAENELPAEKFIMSRYLGISPLIAREIVYRGGEDGEKLFEVFSGIYTDVEAGRFTPVLLRDGKGNPVEYSFTPIGQYGDAYTCEVRAHFSDLTDEYFGTRTRMEHIRQRSSDIFRLLTNADARLRKKIALQSADLEKCRDKERYRVCGDLLTANLWRIERGMKSVTVQNYYDENCPDTEIELDPRMTPSQNAQRYYKLYNKSKSAEVNLTKQLALAKDELAYIDTVFDSLTKADTENDLIEIRRELYESGYASKMKNYVSSKPTAPKPLEFRTSGGYRLLCGKNNTQNDYLTHRLAEKNDLWFHITGYPGSHVILFCGGEEPSGEDYTEAATVAAVYSKAPRGQKVTVDYTRVKNVKKPPASKPGFVTFTGNHSANVTADERLAESLRVRK